MDNMNDSPVGIRVTSQVPSDGKTYFISLASLKDLGTNNNLAYTYYNGMPAYCVENGKTYRWREVVGVEVGLIPANFTYPTGLEVNGINYSNKIYNFFLDSAVAVNQNNFVRSIVINENDLPVGYNEGHIVSYILALPAGQRTIAETDSKVNIIILAANS
jgi:hypothetical protein